jgi:proteasome accessory factor A
MAGQERLFGVETEYAITAVNGHTACNRDEVLQTMMQLARRQLVQLPDLCSGGMFLQNGSRFYIDCGSHPEITTPECADPWDVVRYLQAGDRILFDVARAAESSSPPGTEVMCFRCNVDYSGAHTTWGSHESYLHGMNPAELQPQIIPHLVSRVIYTGAGGFNPLSSGLEFTLSPRAAHIQRVVSRESTSDRGIFHTKQEPLCEGGYNRLHVICGESLCSETAAFLRIGTTALVVAMAEAGLNPGGEVQIKSPLDALRTFAADPTCKKSVRMANWQHLTAIDIQRHYLGQAEAHMDDKCMPCWAGEVCRVWRDILDRLNGDPQSTSQMLDWSMKHALYANHAATLGIPWDRLPFWNRVANRLNAALAQTDSGGKSATLDFVVGPRSPIPEEVALLAKTLQAKGLQWKELEELLNTRRRFFEIDTRFGQVGPKGIFQSLDTAGVLNHRVSGVDNVDQALSEPPAVGRARVRGRVIQRLAGASNARCDWQQIVNFQNGQFLDLSDPFTREESWRPLRREHVRDERLSQMRAAFFNVEEDSENTQEQDPYSRRRDAANRILGGDYSGAEALLRGLLQERFAAPSTHCHLARVLLMTGREAEARAQIHQAWAIREQADAYVVARILFFQCVFTMLDEADSSLVVGQIKAALRAPDAHLDWTILPMLDHLRPRLGETNHQFLKALSEALSDATAMPRLDDFPQWHDAVAAASA